MTDGTDGRHPNAASSDRADDPAFSDVPLLALDQLLEQFVERAQDVMTTQSRLQGLLRANLLITRGLALPEVLRRIVEAARVLVGARYAALGVLAPDGGDVAELIHTGLAPDVVDRIGRLPPGRDLLGVPIRVRGEVYGNLYLIESTRGAFDVEDEQLASALAATAAATIENSHLYEAARLRGEWMQATAAITRSILAAAAEDVVEPLVLIAERSREVAGADTVTIVLPDGDTDLRVAVAVGAGADGLRGVVFPRNPSLSGRALRTAQPLRLESPHGMPGLQAAAPALPDAGPVLVVPLCGADRVHGVLNIVRPAGRPAFTVEDLELATGFANQAAVALELARARTDRQRAALLDERERIAADLHDHVIQRLFATGLSLQAFAATLGPGRTADRIVAIVADIDTTITQIRTAIFQLQQPRQAAPRSLRGRVLDVVGELTPLLGFAPAVRFSGVLDALDDKLSDDLVAVLREALANIAQHAHARSTDIEVVTRDGQTTLTVCDDGVGIGDTTGCSGPATLRRLAERHGGTLAIGSRGTAGTCLTWSVPHS